MEDRYNRQEMIRGLSQKTLSQSRVLVVGAGTTGNEVVKNLALLGVGRISVVDRDLIEEVNLSRCVLFRDEDIGKSKAEIAAQRALKLNPSIVVEAWNKDAIFDIGCLEYGLFDCVILAVDNLETRMWVNRYCYLNNTPLIDTGIDGWIGNVFVMTPPFESCVECGWGKAAYQWLTKRHSCSIELGDEDEKIPMVITSAAIVGGIACQEAVRILHSQSRGTSGLSRSYWFDGEPGAFVTRQPQRNEDCFFAHSTMPDKSQIICEVQLSDSVEIVKRKVKRVVHYSAVEIWHDKSIVYSAICRACSYRHCLEPIPLGKYHRFPCSKCGNLATVPDEFSEELREGYTLEALRIPSNHLLTVVYEKENTVKEAWIMTTRA